MRGGEGRGDFDAIKNPCSFVGTFSMSVANIPGETISLSCSIILCGKKTNLFVLLTLTDLYSI